MTQNQPIFDNQTPQNSTRKPIFTKRRIFILFAVIIACLIAIFFTASIARELNNRAYCARLLRIMYDMTQLYIADHHAFPDSLASMAENACATPDLFVCRSSSDTPANNFSEITQKPGHCSYVYLAAGKPLSYNDNPNFILAYEKSNNHNNGAYVLYADGKVLWKHKAQIAAILSELAPPNVPPAPSPAVESPVSDPARPTRTSAPLEAPPKENAP